MAEKFYSTFEVARICRVSPGSVTRWIKEGKLPASVTAGGHHRVTGRDLQTLLKELKLPALSASEDTGNSMTAKQSSIAILVVDDEEGICKLLEDELSSRGYQVAAARSGAEGLKKIEKTFFQIAVCDVVMPEMNGIEFLAAVKLINPEIEVILMTGHADVEMAVEAMKKGAYDFVQKPFNRAEFAHRIENALEKHQLKEMLKNYEVNYGQTQEKLHKLEDAKKALELAQEELIRSEKLSSIGRFVTGVAHEINNPLTSIIGYSQLLMDYQPPENMTRPLKIMHEQAKRCGKIVQDLMVFAARQNLTGGQWMNPATLVQEALREIEPEIRKHKIDAAITLASQAPAAVWGESSKIRRVFYDIFKNAVQALEDITGPKWIKIEIDQTKDQWKVVIADNGPGIEAPMQRKIFDQFFTTKDVGKGSGLGLSLAFGVVHEHGGQITVKSEAGKGAAFTVELPIKRPQSAGQENRLSSSNA